LLSIVKHEEIKINRVKINKIKKISYELSLICIPVDFFRISHLAASKSRFTGRRRVPLPNSIAHFLFSDFASSELVEGRIPASEFSSATTAGWLTPVDELGSAVLGSAPPLA
jgi:hypothetical protein